MERKYHLFDASKNNLGRMAVEIAKVLDGRSKIDYKPNADGGDFAVVINSDKLKVSGNKMKGKIYHHFSGYPGGITSLSLEDVMKKDSTKVIREAVRGMLPKNKLRDQMIKRLLIYKDDKHNRKIDADHSA